MKNIYRIRNCLPVAFGCFALACVFGAWAAGQIQVTDVGMTSDGHLQIVREGTDPVTVWVRYPGQAEWVPAGKNITTETWVAPFPGEVAQFKIKPYTSADDADFPPDQDDSADDPGDDSDTNDPGAGGDDPVDPSFDDEPLLDDDTPTDTFIPIHDQEEHFGDPPAVSDAAPKSNQAMATPMAGTSQLIWRNTTSSAISCWALGDSTGTNFVIRAYDNFRLLPSQEAVDLNTSWSLPVIAELNNDGIRNDYVWHNSTSGKFSVWHVNAEFKVEDYGSVEYEVSPGVWTNVNLKAPWGIIGVASLDGDKYLNDIIWHNTSNGKVSRWEVDENRRVTTYGQFELDGAPVTLSSDWTLGCIAMLEDDGLYNDMIWHNPTTGQFSYWKVNSSQQIESYGSVTYAVSPGVWTNASLKSPWKIVGVACLDGDGKVNDVIWHNSTLGHVARWDVGTNGRVSVYGKIQIEATPGVWSDVNLKSPWSIRGIASLDGDGEVNDLIWHHPSQGKFSCWRLETFGDDARISDYGGFFLDGTPVTLKSPWYIDKVLP